MYASTSARRRSLIAMVIGAVVMALTIGVGPAAASPAARPGGSTAKSPRSPAVNNGVAAANTGSRTGGIGHVTVGHSSKNDVSPKLRDIKQKAATKAPNKALPVVPLPARPQPKNRTDTAVQSRPAAPNMPSTQLNFDGTSFPGVNCDCAPPDPNGEVGATQYVQIVNTAIQVFDKNTGASVLGPESIESVWSGFGGVCETNGQGDPVVLYDQLANRWLISQFAGTAQPTHECVAVSTSSDATGSWNRYDFDLGTAFGNNYYDYPKLSMWPDAYYMSMNVFDSAGNTFLGPQPFAMDRSAMLAGQPAKIISTGLLSPSDDQLMPADMDGSIHPPAGAPNPFTEIGTNSTWGLWRFHVDFTTPSNSTFTNAGTLTPDPFTLLCPSVPRQACVPQAGTSDELPSLGDRSMFRNAYRRFPDGHEALVGNMTVQSNGVAGIRWWEINNATSGTPRFAQQSTYQPDDTWRWMGSAAQDALGDMAIGFSASSSSINPQIRYAGRLAGDPANTLAQGEAHLFDGAGSQTEADSRWGDYSDLTVDPTDDCTFWYTNEYQATTGSDWKTRIGNFKFPNCTTGPSGTVDGTVTDATNDEPIASAHVDTEFGGTTTNANGHYSINLPVGTYGVTFSRLGYVTDTETGVQINDGQTTTVNMQLQPSPSVTVSGTVTDGSDHGWPLYTRIDVAGDPDSPFFTEPVSGHYSIRLPANTSYQVTFTSQLPGYQVVHQTLDVGGTDITHDVQLSVTPDCTAPGYRSLFQRVDGTTLPAGDNLPLSAVIDPAGKFAYFGTYTSPGRVVKIDLASFQVVDAITLPSGDNSLSSAVIDPAGTFAYFGTYTGPGRVVKIDLASFQVVDAITLPSGDNFLFSAVIDPAGKFAYFGTATDPGQVVKVQLGSCVPTPGGLVEGNVFDRNTGDPINGAKVQSNDKPDEKATTFATPDDANNPDGFYWLFSSPTGSHAFTASAFKHADDTETVNVAADGIVRQDYQLKAPHLTISPTSISSAPVLGETATQTLSFHNDGTVAAHVKLSEHGGSFQILGSQGGNPPMAPPDAGKFSPRVEPGPTSLRNDNGGPDARTVAAPDSPDWQSGAPVPAGLVRYGFAQCADQPDSFYVISGVSNGSLVNTNYRYDAATNTWTTLAPIPAGQEAPAAACLDGRIYVMGGGGTNQMFIYDIASNTWGSGAAVPESVEGAVAGALDGKVYLAGGDDDFTPADGVFNKVEIYDVASNSWSSGSPMPVGASNAGAVQVGNFLYTVGGWGTSSPGSNLTVSQRYDMSADTWDSGPAFMPAKADFALAASGAALYAIGGDNSGGGFSDATGSVHRLDLASWPDGTWEELADRLPAPRVANTAGFCTTAITGGETWSVGGADSGLVVHNDAFFRASGEGCAGVNLAWLDESPTEFDVPIDGTVNVTVTLSATTDHGVTQPGTYPAQITVQANTPQTVKPIDVTMNVKPPKGWGKIAGTVSGTDCQANTAPLPGALIQANGKGYTFSLETGTDATYAFWAPSASNPYTIIASKEAYQAQSEKTVIKANKTTTVNFNLQRRGC